MIIISQDRMSVCNTFDFMIRHTDHDPGVYEVVNKLDGTVYGTYRMHTCKQIIHDIFETSTTYGVDCSYRFPDYDI